MVIQRVRYLPILGVTTNKFWNEKLTIYRFDRELFLAVIRELSNLRKILKMGKHETVGMFGATAFGALWQPFSLGVQIFGI